MNVRRHATLLVLLSPLVMGLSGCGGDAPKPAPYTPSPTTASPRPSTSPSADDPTPPPLPTVAKQKTVAGAKAFAEYYWQMVNYAQSSQDVAPLRKLASETCEGCVGGADGLEEIFDGGGKITGGTYTTADVSGKVTYAGSHKHWEVILRTSTTRETIDMPGTKNDRKFPAASYKTQMSIGWISGGWQIDYVGDYK
jgi:hypothetical protein